ncbi:MAG: hypothetical protein ACYC8W_07790 [Candidatus Tyrphobacter sp.]
MTTTPPAIHAKAPKPNLPTIIGGKCYLQTQTAQQAASAPGLTPQEQAQLTQSALSTASSLSGNGNLNTVSYLAGSLIGMRHSKPSPSAAPPVTTISFLLSNSSQIATKPATIEIDYSNRVPDLFSIPSIAPGAHQTFTRITQASANEATSCKITP